MLDAVFFIDTNFNTENIYHLVVMHIVTKHPLINLFHIFIEQKTRPKQTILSFLIFTGLYNRINYHDRDYIFQVIFRKFISLFIFIHATNLVRLIIGMNKTLGIIVTSTLKYS